MIIYGYAKEVMYTGDGTLKIQVRIPDVHGPFLREEYRGGKVRNYVADEDLPWYPSLLLPHDPADGEVVALASLDSSSSNLLVIGLTGGSYSYPETNG